MFIYPQVGKKLTCRLHIVELRDLAIEEEEEDEEDGSKSKKKRKAGDTRALPVVSRTNPLAVFSVGQQLGELAVLGRYV